MLLQERVIPLRIGLDYSACKLVLEFRDDRTNDTYHHPVELLQLMEKFTKDKEVVDEIQQDKQHQAYIGVAKIKEEQILRLIQKLRTHFKDENEEENDQLDRLPRSDYNKASAQQLQMAKARMTHVFQENIVTPDNPDYVYDKQVEFNPTEDNDWDD